MTPDEQNGYVYEGDPEEGIDFGSCERCGCDLDSDSDELCDQCRWWMEQE